ncbi:MAG TPA: sulfatase [Candidatus Binatia bacterium]|jgi:arylsulfatase A-like enzyme
MRWVAKIVASALGGFVGAALVGLIEAAVIATTEGGDEFGVFRFGVLSYGVIGSAVGGGLGLGFCIVPALARDARAAAATGAGVVAALLGLAVARFRIVRDVFAESLPVASSKGLLVHAGLLVAAVVVLWLLRRIVLALSKPGGTGIFATVALAAVLVGAGSAATAGLDMLHKAPVAPTQPGTATGPSVILIIADTLRADHLGTYGSTTTKTPGIDRLAKDSVVFENAFSNSTWTRPSISTILTSLYPSSHKVMLKTDSLPDGVTTLAEVMKGAGYRTVGYVTNINVAPAFNFEQGFQEYYYLSPDFFFGATDSGSKLAFYSGMRLIRERFISKAKYVQNYYQDAQTVNGAALPWLDHNADGPFFALIHYMDPHDPYFELPYDGIAVARVDTPDPDPSQRDRLEKLYSGEVEYLDRFIANLVDALQASKHYDDTVIALVADHGEEFYEHKGWWHGTTLYDELSHVPVIMKLPKSAKAGTRVKPWAELLDIAPTLVGAAGVTAPDAWQGRDLFSDKPAPAALFQEEDHEGNVLHSIRKDKWKLITANEGNPRGLAPVELYDMQADPHEMKNVAAANAEVVDGLRADLETLKANAGSKAVTGAGGAGVDAATQEKLRSLGYASGK